jgi:FlaA1/EpsC-like NDP-sugar epimerase
MSLAPHLVRNLRNRNFFIMLGLDALVFMVSVWLAYQLRFDFQVSGQYRAQLWGMLALSVPVKVGIFLLFGQYRGMWRYTSLEDFWKLLRLSALQSLVLVAAALVAFHVRGLPRSVFILDWVFTFGLVAVLRLGIRAWHAGFPFARRGGVPALVIGAGNEGARIVHELAGARSGRQEWSVVGLLDEDASRYGRTVHGVPVLGGLDALEAVVQRFGVRGLLIAVDKASPGEMRAIVERCSSTGLPYRILPAMSEILDGRVSVNALRDLRYEDLLGRDPVELDTGRIAGCVAGKVVLVTGAGGSIGSELCRQLVRFSPARLVLVDAGEFNLYSIQSELEQDFGFDNVEGVLGSICDEPLMQRVFADHRPAIVFHAAAYKHVPILERSPWQAVNNNITGSRIVMDAAVDAGVERFVLVSTDKAVRPTNVMGASKRVTELLMQARLGQGTRFMAVRFGNVLGSSGSVVPLFRRQIEKGGPVTVTHPDVTRYFMSIPEAAQLILQAASMGREQGGEVFVLDMGVPVRITDMARDLIRLSGREPDTDIRLVFTGLRPGEKLHEELITAGEGIVRTEHEKILVLARKPSDASEFSPGTPMDPERLHDLLARLEQAASARDSAAIRGLLVQLVPEYTG